MSLQPVPWKMTPSTQSNLFPKLICFFYVETHKVLTSTDTGGGHGSRFLLKTFLEEVHSTRSSCMAHARSLNGFENSPNLAENRIKYVLLQPEMEILSFPQRTGLAPVRKSYRQMGLRNRISLGMRKKHIRIGNKFDCVEGVTSPEDCSKESFSDLNEGMPKRRRRGQNWEILFWAILGISN